MKVLFAGPSLHGFDFSRAALDGIDCRGPAAQGDIARAVMEGATAIGLVDGRYEDVAAPWHKEILYAIASGVEVYGAASMGALRAAECAEFGMIGVGSVFERYRSGDLTDDAAVAQVHGPAELGYLPLSEALVNVEATIARFRALRAISEEEAVALEGAARALFFKDRTYPEILAEAGLASGERGRRLKELIRRCRVEVKREDASVLYNYLAFLDPVRKPAPAEWQFNSTTTWNLTLERAKRLVAESKDCDDTIAA
jgi:hypothetical protein